MMNDAYIYLYTSYRTHNILFLIIINPKFNTFSLWTESASAYFYT